MSEYLHSTLFSGFLQRMLVLITLLFSVSLASTSYAGNVASADGNGTKGADYWRAINQQGQSGYTTAKGKEAGVLINRSGEDWRLTRNQQVKPIGQWMLAGTLGVLFVFYLLVGKNRLDQPRSGQVIERWKRTDRYVHWIVAVLFLLLALTGLSILYAKHFMPDLIGKDGFGTYLQVCKWIHNYGGPVFILTLVIMFFKWVRNNWFNGHDFRWFIQGGGMIKGKHPHAGYMNGGEKLWFWILMLGGVVISLSGLVLDFPAYIDAREDFQLANLIHGAASLIVLCATFAHIYIGSLGTEGALEGMVNGHVDETWAKQHHDLWYDEVKSDR
ncbi:MAG: formate dehydrogenase subunit gamma [Motiliproteus sp.]|nr:formate dehydrogenase subunit gamma [Motiliproteus sp.]MCW9052909.1 formate dehydrogenase subunit gamma [Motiliproteus sp.]